MRWSPVPTKEEFLSRYNTQDYHCECPASTYNPDTVCKHRLVQMGVLNFDTHVIPYNPEQVSLPLLPRSNFHSFYARNECSRRGLNGSIFDIRRFCGLNPNDKVSSENIRNYLKVIVNNPDEKLHFYGTTANNCLCQGFEGGHICKHIKKFRFLNPDADVIVLQPTEPMVVVEPSEPVDETEMQAFYRERNEFQARFNLCGVCYDQKTLRVPCCGGGLCLDCWDSIDQRTASCPYCRARLENLKIVLMNKFKSFNT